MNFLDYEVFLWLDEHTHVKEDLQNYPNIKIKNIKDGKIILHWISILNNLKFKEKSKLSS